MAQLVAHQARNLKVGGSNPFLLQARQYSVKGLLAGELPNENNCNFVFFATRELANAWERGRAEAMKGRTVISGTK